MLFDKSNNICVIEKIIYTIAGVHSPIIYYYTTLSCLFIEFCLTIDQTTNRGF